MGLLSRMPMGGMVGQMDPRLTGFLGQGAEQMSQQAMPQMDASAAAYGQQPGGMMPSMPQQSTDAAAAAYGGQGGPNPMMGLMGAGMNMMQQSQPQMPAPPPPQQLDPYRFRRR